MTYYRLYVYSFCYTAQHSVSVSQSISQSLFYISARCGVGGGADHVAAARKHHPAQCHRAQHPRVCCLDRVGVVYSVDLISSAYFICSASMTWSLRYRCLVSIKLATLDYRHVEVSILNLIQNSRFVIGIKNITLIGCLNTVHLQLQ